MKSISIEELKNKLTTEKELILVDVLEETDFKKSHIKGAVNIPLKRIATEAKKRFDKEDLIVVYCSNYNCSASPTAAKKLENIGFKNVYDYEGGKKEWENAGLPMEFN
ncbi:MAG: rhodanese-like domain-containing protein [Bacteroidales bacterium]|nr:rhodanese-like domain-containing protein [Bacteroidales bacterium]